MNQLSSYWIFDWFTGLTLAGFGVLYGILSGWKWQPGAGLYSVGLLLMGLVQLSPLHTLGAHYLISAHMVGHMLLLLVVAPMLVVGLPKQLNTKIVTPLMQVSAFLGKWPWLGWLTGLGVMWFWHIPAVYDATMAHDFATAYGNILSIPLCRIGGTSTVSWMNVVHVLHPLSVVLAGICFVWPVAGPFRQYRIHPLTGVLYLFTACVGCSALGMLITFAPVGLYQTYTGVDYYGLVHLIRQDWGFDPATDQQTAGLLMWVPGCFLYLTGAMYLLFNWLMERDDVISVSKTNLILEGEKA
ncbi:cytochrome c oxidase assembly protein [Spirosoma pollinicola]|uniref:Cytochrome c oxidase assembly protein n=1 Tax=Spirosoma pollinicola TaxID=2057025 RepID=A0A2K8Z7N4_9BACT|nr:cytochrome c oxidase assembly protein [Spirosoma pollinicola]AUD05882.1 hypothetical protein CWM47_30970 [Spirosoma pollinicola]